MPNEPGSVLVAEIGSTTTRVTLIDVVAGEFRLVSQGEALSSVEPPQQNALAAVIEAVAQIEAATERKLLRDDQQLLMPATVERDGVDRFVAITSATGTLALVITAIASDVSAHSALRASRCTYTSVLQVVTLDDAARQQQGDERSWIERQVQTLLGLQPDAVLIAGGLEGGAEDAINRLAHIVALTAMRPVVDASGQQRQNVVLRPVIYAGNSDARPRVLEALTNHSQPLIVDNLRPSLEEERLAPARQELTRLYSERILTRLPGIGTLRRLSAAPVGTVCAAQGLMTRFLAERYERRVLTLDVGSANSAAYLAGAGKFVPAVVGNCGVGYGLSTVLEARGVERIARWLPFATTEEQLTHWLLNKLLRPAMQPTSHEDGLIELALAREVLALLIEHLRDEQPSLAYDMVLLGGATFAHAPHPGHALLALLDVLQPTGLPDDAEGADEGGGLTLDAHVDSLGLLAAAGALAPFDPDAAVTVCERDLLVNTPLAACVAALGGGRYGEPALEAELAPTRGKARQIVVAHGQIARLPLDQGARGQLTLRPAGGVRIGRNAPGAEVSTNLAEISGSALGVVIDARGRPFALPDDAAQRRSLLWEWLVALGAERGPNPFATGSFMAQSPLSAPASAPAAEPTTPHAAEVGAGEAPPTAVGQRISLDELAALDAARAQARAEPSSAAPANLENDIAKLRQTVEVPKKRGLFGRNK
ncbi:MAG: glutamate mutase L [Chloroflexales bacterium]|nr:glutamate mutase L [Chloroflexales bacterium]